MLLHGYFSNAVEDWIRPGHAELLAATGRRVVMLDLRGHGMSGTPHAAAAYPPAVPADDGFALIERLELTDYDLGGYSLGARTTVRMLARGAAPGRAIVAGIDLNGILHTSGRERSAHFRHVLTNLGSFAPGTPEWRVERHLRRIDGDPVALLHMLDSSVDTPAEALAQIATPTLVVAGWGDAREEVEALAEALPAGRHAVVPGNHTTAVMAPELGTAIADFLGAP